MRADRGSVAAAGQVPEELSAISLRLGWSTGRQGHGQVRTLLEHAPAFILRRVLLDVLSSDPCLVEGRRTAVRVLDDVTASG
jgi:hypothetical protein